MGDLIARGYADTAAGQVHVSRVAGPGAPVVLLHRTPVGSTCFEPMLRLMARRRAAIALDTPGFGMSFTPVGFPAAADYGAWLLAALDAAGVERFHICAHHTGTHFGVELARLAGARAQSLLLSGVLYADEAERAAMLAAIGRAPAVDEAGAYLAATWAIMKSLFPGFLPELCHRELVAALHSMPGRDQAFHAILTQDFGAVLAQVRCPVAVVQASDDPLNGYLARLRWARPGIRIDMLGPAGLAAPELQAQAYAARAMTFAGDVEAGAAWNSTDGKIQ